MRYFCPCCDHDEIQFWDWKPTYKNVVCSNCKTHPRHRALLLYLKRRSSFAQNNLKVLHFAPHSALRKYLSSLPNLNYLTGDVAGYSNGQPVDCKIDITQIPFRNNMFDVVLCSHVLEHVTQDILAMKELLRILKPGGWAFLAVPIKRNAKTFEDPTITSPEERQLYFGQKNHVRYYGTDYKTRLEDIGFEVDEVTVKELFSELSPTKRATYGLHDREILHFGTKPATRSGEK